MCNPKAWTTELREQDDVESLHGLNYVVLDGDGDVRARFLVSHDASKYVNARNAKQGRPPQDETNPIEYVEIAMRGRLDELHLLHAVAAAQDDEDEGGWVRFAEDGSEEGGTCYDDKWAMSEALELAKAQ